MSPAISVVMPVFNVAPFVAQSLGSILGQTFRDLEVIVIDDGSADGTVAEIRKVADPRVRLVEFPSNRGVVAALNEGLDRARGTFLARMDGDDISHPKRLARQLAFLDRHRAIGICGTAWSFFGARGGADRYRSGSAELKAGLLFGSPFSHPTILARRDLLERNHIRYDPAYEAAEDYELWARLARHTEMANLPQILFHQRIHPGSVSHVQRPRQEAAARRVRRDLLGWLGLGSTPSRADTDDEDAGIHERIVRASITGAEPDLRPPFLTEAEAWLVQVLECNRRSRRFDEDGLARVIQKHWYKMCRNLWFATGASAVEAAFFASSLSTAGWRIRWRLNRIRQAP
ncbi:glycosyltransferase family 2 protein [Falsiroseomonas sp. HC035]|uniref:glycosyltransferase family 2 protein n=1 Tax=Falsiroseomonas sp. HC035 TaxID=3390999 RepID=UPI003D31CC32